MYARTPKERLASKARRDKQVLRKASTSTHKKNVPKRKRLVHQPYELGESILHVRNRTGGRSRKVRRG